MTITTYGNALNAAHKNSISSDFICDSEEDFRSYNN